MTTVPTSDLLAFLVEHGWNTKALPVTLRPFTTRQLQRAWMRIRANIPDVARTSDHVRIALLMAHKI